MACAACGSKAPRAPDGPPQVPLHLAPARDLAPAAGLTWLVDAKPREIASTADLIPAIALVVPESRFRAFAASHGDVDLRQVQELCVARYGESLLTLARAPIDPARIEAAFTERAAHFDGRTVVIPNPPVVRLRGTATDGATEQLTVFGRELVALEQARPGVGPKGGPANVAPGPLRAAEAFAQGKLRRAPSALHGVALARAAELLGEAPVRVFLPGPFEGEAAQGLGGLLRASTAVAGAARFAGPPARIAVRVVLMGAWGTSGPAAAERLSAAADVLSASAFGRLLGLDRPVERPRTQALDEALVLEATLDAMALARGIHDAVEAEVGEIMR